MRHCRLNLPAIEGSLRALQAAFPRINQYLQSPRDHLGDDVIGNMLAGYAYVDRLVADNIDALSFGHLHHLLELNNIVLCGGDPKARQANPGHLAATEAQFWDREGGGIRDIVEWYDLHRTESIWQRTAGVYIRVLSEPQLYIEGNHRTGALIMSYLLLRAGEPPFVLTIDNSRAYFDPSTLVTKTRKRSLTMLFRMPKTKRYFADFLKQDVDHRYLRDASSPAAGTRASSASSAQRS